MNSVEIFSEAEQQLELDSALLLYRSRVSNHVYVTRHAARIVDGAPTLMAGSPVTREQLADFVAAASKHTGNHGFVHERTIFTAPGSVAWWAPAANRAIWFKADKPLGTRNGPAEHPALLFVAHCRDRFVFALATNERPTADTPLYQAPYFNVSNSGLICTGNVDIAPQPRADEVEKYENDEFFRSRFTHPNAPKLIAGDGATRLWMDLLDGAPFPTDRLLPRNITVGAVIKHIANRR
jgi:PRTRC genetic system protein B